MFDPRGTQSMNPGSLELADLLREQAMQPGPGEDPQALIDELMQLQPWGMMRRYDEPGEVGPPSSDSGEYQVAGDVVKGPMPRTMEDLQNAIRMQGSSGNMSIHGYGGTKNPYLDLLNILAFPQGGQIRK
jgi:hypothetical protein